MKIEKFSNSTDVFISSQQLKYDGSLQCSMGKAIEPAEMQKELKGLTVHSAINKADGLMHIQQCGTPTGKANVYEIDKKDLPEAKKRGFKEWTFD